MSKAKADEVRIISAIFRFVSKPSKKIGRRRGRPIVLLGAAEERGASAAIQSGKGEPRPEAQKCNRFEMSVKPIGKTVFVC